MNARVAQRACVIAAVTSSLSLEHRLIDLHGGAKGATLGVSSDRSKHTSAIIMHCNSCVQLVKLLPRFHDSSKGKGGRSLNGFESPCTWWYRVPAVWHDILTAICVCN